MDLSFLDKKGTKELKNVLEYVNDRNKFTNTKQKTKYGKSQNRRKIICNSLKNLTKQDKSDLNKALKDELKVVEEIIESLSNFQSSENSVLISQYLYSLMISVANSDLRMKILKILFKSEIEYSLLAFTEAKSKEEKIQYYNLCMPYNLEKSYLYCLISRIEPAEELQLIPEKLILEMNLLCHYHAEPILRMVLDKYNDRKVLIEEINKKIAQNDFSTMMLISKNPGVIEQYCIKLDAKILNLLTWFDKIKNENNTKVEIEEENLNSYSNDWLIFLSNELLNRNVVDQKIGLMIFKYIARSRDINSEQTTTIINSMIIQIKNLNKDTKDIVFNILKTLNTTCGLYEILDYIFEKDITMLKNRRLSEYIFSVVELSNERIYIDELNVSISNVEEVKFLNAKVLTFLMINENRTNKENYNLLKRIKEFNDQSLFLDLMSCIEKVIKVGLDRNGKLILLVIISDYASGDANFIEKVEEYKAKNNVVIDIIIKQIAPELVEDTYTNTIKQALQIMDKDVIIRILKEFENKESKRNCSIDIVKQLMQNGFSLLPEIWNHLSMDPSSEMQYIKIIDEHLNFKKLNLTHSMIKFLNSIRYEPYWLYNYLELKEQKDFLLDLWHEIEENGKIALIVKKMVKDKIDSLDELGLYMGYLDKYCIKDQTVMVLIKIKAYMFICQKLLEIDVECEDAILHIDKIIGKLELFNLVDRFIKDELFHEELNKKIVDYITRKFLEGSYGNEAWEYYWESIIKELHKKNIVVSKTKIEIFFNSLIIESKRIEWFLDIIENKDFQREDYLYIIESLLILLSKLSRIIKQKSQENDNLSISIKNKIGKSISKQLSTLERTVISRSLNPTEDVLVDNVKRLRRALREVDIESVEEIDKLGLKVFYDNNKHENKQPIKLNDGIVDSLGIKINNDIILLGTLLNREEDLV